MLTTTSWSFRRHYPCRNADRQCASLSAGTSDSYLALFQSKTRMSSLGSKNTLNVKKNIGFIKKKVDPREAFSL